MSGFYPGPPYFFFCKDCGHRYRRDIKLALFCPQCRSFRVMADPTIRK